MASQGFDQRNRRSLPLRAAISGLIGTLVLAACATGQRPSFDDEQPLQADTGDEAIDAVLDRLDGVTPAQFTAEYKILTRLGDLNSVATVVQADNSRRSVTINDVRFVDTPSITATCNLVSDECEASINNARVSDLQLSDDFYGRSFARRLRVDADRRTGDTTGYEITQADESAVCVDVPVTGGTVVYCALDTGPLARYNGNDLLIELTAVTDVPDESMFATS